MNGNVMSQMHDIPCHKVYTQILICTQEKNTANGICENQSRLPRRLLSATVIPSFTISSLCRRVIAPVPKCRQLLDISLSRRAPAHAI
jgi:hypothetical protein